MEHVIQIVTGSSRLTQIVHTQPPEILFCGIHSHIKILCDLVFQRTQQLLCLSQWVDTLVTILFHYSYEVIVQGFHLLMNIYVKTTLLHTPYRVVMIRIFSGLIWTLPEPGRLAHPECILCRVSILVVVT